MAAGKHLLEKFGLPRLVECVIGRECSRSQIEKFLGEICLLLRILNRLDPEQLRAEQSVVNQLGDMLVTPKRLLGCAGYFRQVEAVFAYANIRDMITHDAYLEGLLDALAETDCISQQAPPYRVDERAFILYVSGRQVLNVDATRDCLDFCKRVADFNVDDCYILTHVYIYRSDFGLVGDLGPEFRAALFVVAEKAIQWENCDLFLEAYICLVRQDLLRRELAYLECGLREVVKRLSEAVAGGNLADYYHEAILYRIALALRPSGQSVLPVPHLQVDFELFREFVKSLQSKDVKRIGLAADEVVKLTGNKSFYEIASHRLDWICEMACRKLLFRPEEVAANVNTRDEVYSHVIDAVKEARLAWSPTM